MAFRSLASRLRLPSTTECEADAGALNTLESVHETESFPVPGHLETETHLAVDGVDQLHDGERKVLIDNASCSVDVGDEHMSLHGMETMPLSPPPSQRPIRQLSGLLSPPPRRAPDPPVGMVAQYCTELKHLLRAGGPVIVSSSLTQLLTMVDISFVGLWLGPAAMAAASTANAVFNMMLVPVTAAAQATDSAIQIDQKRLQALYYKRMLSSPPRRKMALTASSVTEDISSHSEPRLPSAPTPSDTREDELVDVSNTAVAHLFRGAYAALALSLPVMLAVGAAGHAVGNDAVADYVESLVLGVLPLAIVLVVQKWLTAYHIILPGIIVGIVANCANVGLDALLIEETGFIGSSLAATLCRLLQCVLLLLYLRRAFIRLAVSGRASLAMFWKSLSDVPELLHLLFWSTKFMGLFAVETWPYDVTTLLASRLGFTAMAAHTVLLYFSSFMFMMLPLGVSLAARDRISMFITLGDGVKAKRAGMVAAATAVCCMFLSSMITLGLRTALAGFFVRDAAVAELVADLGLISAVYQILDGYQGSLSCLLRGVSQPHDVMVTAIVSCSWWIIGLPIAAVLMRVDGFGVTGIWYGMVVAVGCAAVALTALFRTLKWEKVAEIRTKPFAWTHLKALHGFT